MADQEITPDREVSNETECMATLLHRTDSTAVWPPPDRAGWSWWRAAVESACGMQDDASRSRDDRSSAAEITFDPVVALPVEKLPPRSFVTWPQIQAVRLADLPEKCRSIAA
jgi:hypothetical protein